MSITDELREWAHGPDEGDDWLDRIDEFCDRIDAAYERGGGGFEAMTITDELREYANIATDRDIYAGARLCKIADRIDAEADDNERFRREAEPFCNRLREAAAERADVTLFGVDYVALPLDADGVPIRVGDELVIFETGERVRAYDIELYANGRWLVIDEETMDSIHPDRLRHYHAPTVEDVLREFAEKITDSQIPNVHPTYEEAIADYAKRLRLAEEVDA